MTMPARMEVPPAGRWLRRDGTLRKRMRKIIVHECGHALCAWRLGWWFKDMQIVAADDMPSCVRVRCPREAVYGQGPVPPAKVPQVENMMRLYAAGQLSVMIWGEWKQDPAWEKAQLRIADTASWTQLLRRLKSTPGYRDRRVIGRLRKSLQEPRNWATLVCLAEFVERFVLKAVRRNAGSATGLERVTIPGRTLRGVLRRLDQAMAAA